MKLLPFIVLIVVFVFLIAVPMRRQMRAQRATRDMQAQLAVGDDVMTTSGLYGTVVGMDGGAVDLRIAPDVVVRCARAAIGERQVADAAVQPEGIAVQPEGMAVQPEGMAVQPAGTAEVDAQSAADAAGDPAPEASDETAGPAKS
ncbi:MAG: preprotein translocase subunit YajC [Mycobacteriales bacterium]